MGYQKPEEIDVKTKLRKKLVLWMIFLLPLVWFGLEGEENHTSVRAAGKRIIREKQSKRQTPPFQIEAWEIEMNLRQPPLKIMDAIGLLLSRELNERLVCTV